MKKTFRSFTAIMLAVAMMVLMIPFCMISASAAYNYLFPVNNGGAIAYGYGYSASYGAWHDGIDIHSSLDDTIYAACDGVVEATANSCYHVSCGYRCEHYNTYGNYIRIGNSDGIKAYYGHLKQNSLLVSVGQSVKRGQPIATMGSSGYSTGKHLHFELRASDYSTKINTNPTSSGGEMNYSYGGHGNTGNNPQGVVDSANGGNGTISIRGWAFDADDTTAQLGIHVYVGGPAGSGAPGYAITANIYRPDVNNVYGCGDYHGYDATISVSDVGTKTLYIYAINVGGGSDNPLIGTANVNISSPIVSNISLSPKNYSTISGNTNSFYFSANNVTRFDIRIDKDGVLWKYEEGVNSGVTYTFTEPGNYSVFVAGHNSISYQDSDKIYINVIDSIDFGEYFYSKIFHPDSSKVVTVDPSDNNVEISTDVNSPYQMWYFERQSDNSYKITNLASDKCLDLYGSITTNGNNIQQHDDNGGANQRWYILGTENGYNILSKCNTDTTVDLYGNYTTDGSNISIHECNDSAAQEFEIKNEGVTSAFKPTKTMTLNGNTYEYYNYPLFWTRAEKLCERMGGHLVTITSKEEQNLIQELTSDCTDTFSTWVGATDQQAEGTWIWVTGETMDYTNWISGQPDNAGGCENYMALYNNGFWNDVQNYGSSYNINFICEYDSVVQSKYTVTRTKSLNNHVYKYYEGNFNWQEAKMIAEKMGGYLVSINSQEEEELVTSMIEEGTTWLGGTDVYSEGKWEWLSGGNLEYSNWYSGMPDNYLGHEHYIQLYGNGTWNDCSLYVKSISGIIVEFERNNKGDINGDGVISIADATTLQKYLANIVDFNDEQLAVADTNGDGSVSIADATQIQKYLANIISSLG